MTRTRVAKIGFALAIVAGFFFFALRSEEAPGAVLVVVDAKEAAPRADGFVLSSFVAQLDPREREELADVLALTSTRLEARRNPLLEDLGEGDPEEDLRKWSVGRREMLEAAAALTPAKRCATDGFCVRVAASCPAGARCIPAWGDAVDAAAARARFLAWPIAGSVLLRAADMSARERLVSALRRRAREPGSTIALVLTPRDTDIAGDPKAHAIAEAWSRSRSLSPAAREHHLDDAAPQTTGLPIAWTDLDVLVVPRIATLTSPKKFADEVVAHAGRARVLGAPQ